MLIEKQHLQAQNLLLSYPRMRHLESCLHEGFEVFVRGAAVLSLAACSKFIFSSQNHSARKIVVEYLQK